MNHSLIPVLCALLFCTPERPVSAQEEAVPSTATALLEVIEVDEKIANLLILKYRNKADAKALQNEVDLLIEKNTARLYDCIFSRVGLNRSVNIQAHEEIVSPTEFDGETPGDLASTELTTPVQSTISTAIIPTAYETRLAGSEFEVRVSQPEEPGKIQISSTYTLTTFLGKEPPVNARRKLPGSVDNYHWNPKFHTARHNSTHTLLTGKPTLLDVFESAKNRDKRLLMILTVWVED